MGVAEWTVTYGIHHRRVLWSSYKSWSEWDFDTWTLNSVQTLWETELSGYEFNSVLETTLYRYSNYIYGSVSDFFVDVSSVSHHIYFHRNFLEIITWVWRNKLIYMVFTIEGFFEASIKSWSDWNLNPLPLNSLQTL